MISITIFSAFVAIASVVAAIIFVAYNRIPWLAAYVDFSERGRYERNLISVIKDCTVPYTGNRHFAHGIFLTSATNPEIYIAAVYKYNSSGISAIEINNTTTNKRTTIMRQDAVRVFGKLEDLVLEAKQRIRSNFIYE